MIDKWVNAHTHLELSELAHLRPSRFTSMPGWLWRVARSLRCRDATYFRNACEKGIRMLHAANTTHVGDISWTGESVAPLARSGLRGVVWIELRGIALAEGRQRLYYLEREIERLRNIAASGSIQVGLEIHAPYTLHPALWDPALRWVERERLPLAIHAAESPAERALFLANRSGLKIYETMMDLSGLPGFLRLPAAFLAAHSRWLGRRIGCSYPLSRKCTPVAYLESVGALQFQPFLVHLVEVTMEDIDCVRRNNAVAVHCPRSNAALGCNRMPLEQFLAAGCSVMLGTDSLASVESLDMRDEVKAARKLHGNRVCKEAILKLARHAERLENLM